MNKISRYYYCLFILCNCTMRSVSQTHIIDSLEDGLKYSMNDSVRFYYLNALAQTYFAYDTSKAKEVLAKGYTISKKLNWDKGFAEYYYTKGVHYQITNDYNLAFQSFDSSIFYFKKADKILTSKQEKEAILLEIATVLGEKASNLMKIGRGAESIPLYLNALELWKASDEPRKTEAVGTYYEKIATTFYDMKQYDKALEYDKLSLTYRTKSRSEDAMALSYVYVCDDFLALKQLDSCLLYLKLAKPLVERLNNHTINVQYYNKLAAINLEKKEYRLAIPYYEKCVSEAINTNSKFQVLANQRMIAVCYVRLGEYATARKYLLMALPAAIEGNHFKSKIEILQDLVTTEEKDNKPASAYKYLKEVVKLRDSLNMENTKLSIAEIENKYQTAEKSKTILQLENDKQIQKLSIRQKSIFNYFLVAFASIFLIAAYFALRTIRHRNALLKKEAEIHQQKIRELEKDKQLVAVDSLLKGQEEERSRLAKDLHDGLGGLLSGVKFSLRNMKDNLIITPDNMTVFERSLEMLDNSIKELRRVAHNMMPELLTKFGLNEALKEYCNSINTTNHLKMNYQSIGMDARMEKSQEIIIYRIIQELLNNTMKHAAATEAMVQLVKEEGRLSIIIEDNGKGFDTSILKNNKGAGLTSVQSRVDYLKGRLDIHSEISKGTLITIEFNL